MHRNNVAFSDAKAALAFRKRNALFYENVAFADELLMGGESDIKRGVTDKDIEMFYFLYKYAD